jgi:septation ring formation regulator EzrA
MDKHAEIKDTCSGLETRLDEIGNDIRDLHFDYKLVDKYSHIDEEMFQIYEWYEYNREWFLKYEKEKVQIENKLKELDKKTKLLNNEVQALKLQAFSRDQHGDLCSQLPNIRRP